MDRILVVEDEPFMRGLAIEVLADWGYDVIGAGSAADAMRAAAEFGPDLAIVDIQLGQGPSGLDLVVSLRGICPDLPIVFLSNVQDVSAFGRIGSPPADAALVSKADISNGDALIRLVQDALDGDGTSSDAPSGLPIGPSGHLTHDQAEVLRMVAAGASNKRIAETRGTTERAVEGVIQRAAKVLGVRSGDDVNVRVLVAVAYARAVGSLRDG